MPLASPVPLPGQPVPVSAPKLSFIEQFRIKAESQGEPEELLGPGRGLEGGAGCLHLRVNTRCPLPSAETVCVSFSLLLFVFCLFFFFYSYLALPHPPYPPSHPLVRSRYNLLKERTSFNLGSLVSFTGE